MPTLRSFRALRYDTAAVGDLSAVICPPYDVIAPAQRESLLARHPYNAVRVEFPVPPGAENGGYRRAALTLETWQAQGVLRLEPGAAVYVYEQRYRFGATEERTQRGVFVRLLLEPWGDGVRPHERTLSGPKQDRLRLLRAMATDTSPIVVLAAAAGRLADVLDVVAGGTSDAEATDDAGTRHRLWVVPQGQVSESILRAAGDGALTIADGHHRYETALRYRDERMTGAPVGDDRPGWASILMLLLEPVAGPLTVLATHRVLTGIAGSEHAGMDALPELFEVEPAERGALARAFEPGAEGAGGRGRLGLWTRDGGFVLTARRAAFEPWLPDGGASLRRLDVSLAGAAIERLTGIDAEATTSGRIRYTKDPLEAMAWVDARADDADAALLLEPTPQADIVAVAADGDVMHQKSTYIYPKALTGLVINPLE